MTTHDRTVSVQSRMLGNELRRLRATAGLTQEQAAAHLSKAANKVSRVENGVVGIDKTDLDALLSLYDAPEKDAVWVRHLAQGSRRRRGRPTGETVLYRGPKWFRSFYELERDATEVSIVCSEIMTGILQTDAYIRAMFAAQGIDPYSEPVTETIRLRAERRKLLTKDDAATFSFVISESALQRHFGSAKVMFDQHEHLVDLAMRPNITIQVMPFVTKSYEPMGYDFTVLRFDTVDDCVYLEMYDDAAYLDKAESVGVYADLLRRLQRAALGPVESRNYIVERFQ
ncbi:helix-turn-helix domain-containing protein [Actinokineospora pegani]|uniref:helix-turn-helix domain-containing protein n=1 Tax=Actinokineospora pegani TaxID=2654637 RepID=UPI0012EAA758|nr:helix-turn-helix transcriptional regulator [Actinokineospora pegani]